MGELLRLTNHHPVAPPVISERSGRYLGYFENSFGEQLVFVHDHGHPEATLYHGDVDWKTVGVSDRAGDPHAADLLLGREERAFLCACWTATATRRARSAATGSTAGDGGRRGGRPGRGV